VRAALSNHAPRQNIVSSEGPPSGRRVVACRWLVYIALSAAKAMGRSSLLGIPLSLGGAGGDAAGGEWGSGE
jgi:hypothetical protein